MRSPGCAAASRWIALADARGQLQVVLDVALALVAVSPARPGAGRALLELVDGAALPAAEVPLAERGVEDDREVEPGREDLGRLARAVEVAGVHGRDRLAGELVRKRAACSRPRSLSDEFVWPWMRRWRSSRSRRGGRAGWSSRAPRYGSRVDLGLRDRVCVVTGSTAGIGLEVVRQLAAEGALVVVCGQVTASARSTRGRARALRSPSSPILRSPAQPSTSSSTPRAPSAASTCWSTTSASRARSASTSCLTRTGTPCGT